MYRFMAAATTVAVLALAAPAAAQSIGDIGRALQQQVLPRQGADPRQEERDRAIYEQGRRDTERGEQGRFENRRRDKRHGNAHRREDSDRYEQGRHRAKEERSRDEDQRAWRGRY